MRLRAERWLALAAAASLAACAGGGMHGLVSDTPMKLGRPYTVGGRVYVPSDDPRYDRTGLASWYGRAEQGRATANGERFDRRRASAAHATLPMPCYVAVTRLDTGRSMLVRINDRGPYARDRLIDLSEAAARQLGIDQSGTALVRVRRVSPTARQRDALRRGYPVMLASVAPTATPPRVGRTAPTPAPPPSDSPPPSPLPPPPGAEYLPEPVTESYSPPQPAPQPIPTPTPTPSPVPTFSRVVREIVVATPADPDAADALASALVAEHGRAVAGGAGYRVVTGPYPDEAARSAALARLRARGYQGAVTLDAPTTNPPEATGFTPP